MRRKEQSVWLLKKMGKRGKNKSVRRIKGKVCKHHFFKYSRAILMMEIDQKRAQSLIKQLKERKRNPVYDSVQALFAAESENHQLFLKEKHDNVTNK